MMKRYDLNLLRLIGICYGKNAVSANKEVYADGYLIEKRPDKLVGEDKDGKKSFTPDGYDIIALSVVGGKPRIETFMKKLEEESFAIQQKDKSGPMESRDDAYEIHIMKRVAFNQLPLSLLETEQVVRKGFSITIEGPEEGVNSVISLFRLDVESTLRCRGGHRARFYYYGSPADYQCILDRVKVDGCTVTHKREITEGTIFKRCLLLNPKCRPDHLDGDSKEAYLIGETHEEARSQFWSVLDRLTPPFQPEWEEAIWKEFNRRGWVTPLEGHRIVGYKLHLDQEELLDMLSEGVKSGALRGLIPEEEKPAEAEVQAEAA